MLNFEHNSIKIPLVFCAITFLAMASIKQEDNCSHLEFQEDFYNSNVYKFNKGKQLWKCYKFTKNQIQNLEFEMVPVWPNSKDNSVLTNNNILLLVSSSVINKQTFDLSDILKNNNSENYICNNFDGFYSRQLFVELFCQLQDQSPSQIFYIYIIYKYNLKKPEIKNRTLPEELFNSNYEPFSQIDSSQIQIQFIIKVSQDKKNHCQGTRNIGEKQCSCNNPTMITQSCNVEAIHVQELKQYLVLNQNSDKVIFLYIYNSKFYESGVQLKLNLKSINGDNFFYYFQETNENNDSQILPIIQYYSEIQVNISNEFNLKLQETSNDFIFAIVCESPVQITFEKLVDQETNQPVQITQEILVDQKQIIKNR